MSMNKKAAAFCAASALLCLSSAYADEVDATQSDELIQLAKRWVVNVNVEKVTFDERKAAYEGVDSEANAILLEGEYFFDNHLSTVVGVGYLKYDDNYKFTQTTQSVYGGGTDDSGSTASAIPLIFDVGYTRFYGDSTPVYVTVRGGLNYLLASDRGIENCVDCYSEDIELDGGVFAQLGAGINLGRSFTLGLYYKNYMSGDMEDAVGLKLSFGRFRAN